MGLFSEQLGGKQAAVEWAERVDSAVRYRRINGPSDLFGQGGILTAEDIDALQRRRRNSEVDRERDIVTV